MKTHDTHNEDNISIFAGDDFEEANDHLLAIINEALGSSASLGPPFNEKVAKIVNKKFSSDLGLAKRKQNDI